MKVIHNVQVHCLLIFLKGAEIRIPGYVVFYTELDVREGRGVQLES